MKLVNLSADKFDELVKGEPGNSYCQTSSWAKYKSEYEPMYLGYVNDRNIYSAFALILAQKGTLLNKATAYCPNGFLINYYDTDLLIEFTKEVKKYLRKYNINKLVITPNVNYITVRGNNDLLIKRMKEIGYQKTNSHDIYTNKVVVPEQMPETIEDVVLDTYIVEDNNQRAQLFEDKKEYSRLYNALKDNIDYIVCAINLEKTKANLLSYINKTPKYVEMHKDDYEYDQLIIERQEITNKKQELLNLVNGIENPILCTTAFIGYNHKIVQLYIYEKEEYKMFNAQEFLNYKTMQTFAELNCDVFESYTPSKDSSKTSLIGEFTLNI